MKDRFGFDWSQTKGTRFWRRPHLGRRMFFRHLASAVGGYFLLPTRPSETIAKAAATTKGTAKNCIFVLMSGGPSHVDTFDLKEGAWTPAGFSPTSYNGVRWPTGLLPNLANQLGNVALVRSVRAWALVHVLARTWVMIGRNPAQGNSRFAPHIGSVVSQEFAGTNPNATLPAFVSLNVTNGPSAGFLSSSHNPFYLSPGGGGMANTTHAPGVARFDKRAGLLAELESEMKDGAPLGSSVDETFNYNVAARKLMYNQTVSSIFTFDAVERARYGSTGFGNACIAARRMLRANEGVRFIQITQGDWDQHENIYTPNAGHWNVARQFDNGIATLIADLKADGLLDETLVVCMGEFGRTVGGLNNTAGRDHFLQQAILMAGGGVQGGKVLGTTDRTGAFTEDPGWSRFRDIRPEDIEATIYSALGIDYTKTLEDPSGRGFEYVPFADRDQYGPIHELWG
jgi:hypothetical protein